VGAYRGHPHLGIRPCSAGIGLTEEPWPVVRSERPRGAEADSERPRGHPGRRNHSLIAAAETSTLPQNFGSSALVLRIPERPVIAACPAHHFGCLQTQDNTHHRLLVKTVATYVIRRSTRSKIRQSVWLPGPAHRRSPDLGAGLAARAARDPGWPPWPTPSTHTRMIASTTLRATSPAQSPTSPGHGWPSSLPNQHLQARPAPSF
jgi:hypothetical protein